MATKIKTFDFDQPSTLTTTDKATYPWDLWFDGDIWEITWNEDFQTHPLMMERIIRTRATGRGAKVRLRHVPTNGDPWGRIIVQRTDLVGPNEAKTIARKEKAAATRAANKPTNGHKMVTKKAPPPPTKRITKRALATAS
jgi:hypothetical protein